MAYNGEKFHGEYPFSIRKFLHFWSKNSSFFVPFLNISMNKTRIYNTNLFYFNYFYKKLCLKLLKKCAEILRKLVIFCNFPSG